MISPFSRTLVCKTSADNVFRHLLRSEGCASGDLKRAAGFLRMICWPGIQYRVWQRVRIAGIGGGCILCQDWILVKRTEARSERSGSLNRLSKGPAITVSFTNLGLQWQDDIQSRTRSLIMSNGGVRTFANKLTITAALLVVSILLSRLNLAGPVRNLYALEPLATIPYCVQ